jgi:lipoprotein NlpD
MSQTVIRSNRRAGRAPVACALWVCLLIGACTTAPNRAPVEDRATQRVPTAPAAAAASAPASVAATGTPDGQGKPPAGIENLGKPGYYAVKPGDTLLRVALENGQNWRDIARWNNIDNPNVLEVGQVLRVVPPGVDPTAVATKGVTTARVEARPLDSRPLTPAPTAPPASASAPAPAVSPPASPPAASPAPAAAPPVAAVPAPTAAAPRDADDDVAWAWPSAAPVAAPFDEGRNKGLVFSGRAGDPVLAAADGRVVYAGSGLRGYGNLVIVKHNNSYLTAYAHNQALLVKEDQAVRRGQKIAEMGSSDAERVQLHFEIRRLGKPVDPARLLPPR